MKYLGVKGNQGCNIFSNENGNKTTLYMRKSDMEFPDSLVVMTHVSAAKVQVQPLVGEPRTLNHEVQPKNDKRKQNDKTSCSKTLITRELR